MVNREGHAGFTMVELMATLAVLAILLAVAAPSLRAVHERHAALSTFHSLSVALAAARMAAIQRGRPVTVCPSKDGRSCRGDLVWDEGWLVYADPTRASQPADASAVLWVERRAPGNVTIRSSPGRHRMRFQPTGLSGGNNTSLRLCSRDGRFIGKVVLSLAGRARRQWVSADSPVPCPYLP